MGSQQKTPLPAKPHHTLNTFAHTEPHTIHLRDGEVVLFKRQHSQLRLCRYKLAMTVGIEPLHAVPALKPQSSW